MSELLERAADWVAADPDPITRAELQTLIEANDLDQLAERMHGSLPFGTAGLRGAVEAGSNRMNRAVIIRTTRGLADYLLDRYDGTPPGPVVVGRDARLSSPQFMADTIATLAGAGLEVRFFEGDTPTPLVAFAALHLDACAAIVITASHNPAADNGYKVYDRNGAQIVPPIDTNVTVAIARVGPANQVPLADIAASDLVGAIGPDVHERYQQEIAALRVTSEGDSDLRIVYTPMHGVGWKAVEAALTAAGYLDLHPVPEQVEPDGEFPTAPFPNPEEPGALDLSAALADMIGADIVIANDPDADRLAIALPSETGWSNLTGNQIGVLLADYVLNHHASDRQPLVINSIVSSPMLADIAAGYGARFETTLTGFKWIANAALDIEEAGIEEGEDARGAEFVFGYEEALGYTVGSVVRDKDGISAALVFADLVVECRRAETTVRDRLSSLYRRFGFWISTQKSIVRPGNEGAGDIARAMTLLKTSTPDTLGGAAVTNVTDYRQDADRRTRWLPESPLVVFDLDNGYRVLVRPSGTEPKLKIYVDARATVPEGCDPFDLEADLVDKAQAAAAELAAFLDLE